MTAPHAPSPEELARHLLAQYTEIAKIAGGLAHEIKNPLSTIRLNMELLAEDFVDAETPRDRRALSKIRTVERECLRLQNLLDDFLSYAKLRTLKKQAIDLNEELERILQFFAPQAEQTGVELITYFDADLPRVVLDQEAFRGAILNLLLNAQQAMPDGGQLVVRTRPSALGVAIELIDNGEGMNAATQEHIFEAFYSTKSNGSGLGLPTARKIVEAHGGTIRVESVLGTGTHFTIELPALPRLTASPLDEDDAAPASAS